MAVVCHEPTYAVQQGLGSYFASRLAVGAPGKRTVNTMAPVFFASLFGV
jgi:hypothetical protein